MSKSSALNLRRKRTTLIIFLAAILVASILAFALQASGVPQPILQTDKQIYAPGETVQIFGSGFASGAYDIPVIRPDGTIVKGDGNFTPGWDTVQADGNGNLLYYYKLDGIEGLYEARVYNSPWNEDRTQTPIANVTFYDPPPKADLDQVRNGPADNPTDPGEWVNGNIGAQQGHYVEGYSIPYRAVITDAPTGVNIRLIIGYDTKHSDKHAIDYLTYYSRINSPFLHQDVFGHSQEAINPLSGFNGTFWTTTFAIPAPEDSDSAHAANQPSTSFNSLPAGEKLMILIGGTITGISYVKQENLTGASIAETQIAVNFTLTSSNAVLTWGGHIASRLDWGFEPDGTPHSAGGISGSPYHMRLINWTDFPADPRDDLPNLGNTDRSLSAVAVFAPPVPFIALTKTASAPKVLNTTLVTYTYNVTNVGGVNFTSMNITDNVFGVITSGQTLAINESKTYTFPTTLNHTTTNIATAFGTTQAGATVNATANATVTVIHPALSLTKTPTPTKVENGSSVTYTYNVTNIGDTSLTVSLVDNVFGTIFTGKVMAPGASNITTITQILTHNTTNIATATGIDQLGTSVNATASATVRVLHPSITLTKTPSSNKVENHTNVTYTYNVTNTGDTSLTVSLVDNQFGTIFTDKVLAAGASNITTITRALTVNTTNIATATGVDQTSTSVQAQATATVTVLHPAISLTKTPSSSKVENGSSVTYTYNVTNIGDTSLTVSLVDNQFGTIFTGKVLAPGASNITTITRMLTSNTTNTATATGVDQLSTSVQAQASATVRVLHPSLTLTKTPSASKVENGTSVTYTYNVTNTGDVALTGNVTDNVFGLVGTFTNLGAGNSALFTVPHVLTANTTNIATAIGVDQAGGVATAQASATVRVLHPSVSLTKTPSASKVENGTSVTYTYNVTNTGDVALLNGNLTDSAFGYVGSFFNLGAGNSVLFTVPHVLTQNTTNIATVFAVDQLGSLVNANATAFVHVIHPAITLTKTPSASKVLNTTSVTYTYNVTNTGDTPLTVNLTDNQFGTIFTGKVLAPGSSNITTITRLLNSTTTNIATATGADQLSATRSVNASATVTVIHPAISVTKTCSPEDQLAPGNITWTVVVRNIGDVPLSNFNITESRPTLSNFTIAGPLAPGGTITIIFNEYNLPPGTYYNNATAYASHQLGTVSAWDDANCTIRPVFILKQFVNVTVLPVGTIEGFNATLVNSTNVNVYGLKTGPKVYFTVQYYFENSLNFLGSSFDGQAHNFTLWDKWGGNLMALGSPPVAFNQTTNIVTLADNSTFDINPRLSGPGSYRDYIGSGLNITNLASQGQAWITMHLGDQQNSTNPGKGKGTGKDGSSYDTDTVWYIGQLGVNQSATLTLYIAPGKNPGGQLEFTSAGCTVINTGPRVRAYENTYNDEDFLYAVERTNTLTVCAFDIKPTIS